MQILACFIFLASMSCLLILCSLTFSPPASVKSRPASMTSSEESQHLLNNSSWIEKIIYVQNWRNPRFVIWALILPCALFGYFVPFVHLVQFAKSMPLDDDPTSNTSKASSLLACISVTSGSKCRLYHNKYFEGINAVCRYRETVVWETLWCILDQERWQQNISSAGLILLHGLLHHVDEHSCVCWPSQLWDSSASLQHHGIVWWMLRHSHWSNCIWSLWSSGSRTSYRWELTNQNTVFNFSTNRNTSWIVFSANDNWTSCSWNYLWQSKTFITLQASILIIIFNFF